MTGRPAPLLDRIGNYRIKKLLGEGGMGHVYLAVDEVRGCQVALKVVHVGKRFALAELLGREAELIGLVSHPNVAAIQAFGYDEGMVLIAMDLVDGETLAARLARGHRWTPAEAAAVLYQVAIGIGAIHAAGLVHLDLKPSNIMLLPDGRVKVLDCGLARLREDAAFVIGGTPSYMAPEQIADGPVGPWSDVWAIGAIGYHMVSGERPYGDGAPTELGRRIRGGAPPLLAGHNVGERFFGTLLGVIRTALTAAIEGRYPNGYATATALADLGAATAMPIRPTWRAPAAVLELRWLTLVIVAAVIAAVLLTARALGRAAA